MLCESGTLQAALVTAATADASADEAALLDELRAKLEATTEKLGTTTQERDAYKKAFELAQLELDRLRRNLFGKKGERVDPAQVALVFEPFRKLLEEARGPAQGPDAAAPSESAEPAQGSGGGGAAGPGSKDKERSRGRRNLAEADLPEEVIRLVPPGLPEGAAELEVDVSYRLEWKRGGWVRLRIERPRFAVPASPEQQAETGSDSTVVTADAPAEMIPRGLPGPALLAKVVVSKMGDHAPFHRQEGIVARDGIDLDRSTMGRWAAGCHELAKYVVDAMAKEACDQAAVIATDATGVLVQHPERCKRGHFWVAIADRDHVFFRYTARHNQDAPKTFLKGFRGYLQADASSVYDALYRQDDGPEEVGCWSHARRNFFWAVRSHRQPSLVALGFCNRLFEIEREMKAVPPSRKTELRRQRAGPVLEALRAWKDAQLGDRSLEPRSPLARALRYLDRHWEALTRFLEDGRLRLDNNPSELELRRLVVDRSLCTLPSSARNHERATVVRIATRATRALAAAA